MPAVLFAIIMQKSLSLDAAVAWLILHDRAFTVNKLYITSLSNIKSYLKYVIIYSSNDSVIVGPSETLLV